MPKYAAKPEDLRSCYWISECGPECRICGILENVVSTGVGISVDITESEDIRFGPLYWGFTFSSTSCGLLIGILCSAPPHAGPYVGPLHSAPPHVGSYLGLYVQLLLTQALITGLYHLMQALILEALQPHAGPYFGA